MTTRWSNTYIYCCSPSFHNKFIDSLGYRYLIYYHCIGQDVEELMSLAPEKMLLKWMNFHLKKAGYKKTVSNFSSDVKVHSGI